MRQLIQQICGALDCRLKPFAGYIRCNISGKIQVQMDLTPESWAALEKTLREQDTLDKCGMFTKASDGMTFLKELAAKGISVKIPDKIFRAVDLPAQLQQSVEVNKRPIGLRLSAQSLRVDTATLWTSASVQVQVQTTRAQP